MIQTKRAILLAGADVNRRDKENRSVLASETGSLKEVIGKLTKLVGGKELNDSRYENRKDSQAGDTVASSGIFESETTDL